MVFAIALIGSVAHGQVLLVADNASFSAAVERRAHPDAVQLQGLEYVVPEVIIGGEWTSTIRFTNRGTSPVPTTNVYLVDNAGNPMLATFQITNGTVLTASAFSVALGIGGVLEATFIGGPNSVFGHAIIGCSTAGCGTAGIYD